MAEDFLHFMADLAERRIVKAMEEGTFDHLPGEGRPLILEDDSRIPADLRMAFKVLRNAGYVPPEIAERREIENLLDLLEDCQDEAEKLRQMRKLDVILARVRERRSRPVTLDEHDPYYEKVTRRISLLYQPARN